MRCHNVRVNIGSGAPFPSTSVAEQNISPCGLVKGGQIRRLFPRQSSTSSHNHPNLITRRLEKCRNKAFSIFRNLNAAMKPRKKKQTSSKQRKSKDEGKKRHQPTIQEERPWRQDTGPAASSRPREKRTARRGILRSIITEQQRLIVQHSRRAISGEHEQQKERMGRGV